MIGGHYCNDRNSSRKEEVDRIISYIDTTDERIQAALQINPADELVNCIALKAKTVPSIVRRAGATIRSPPSYFHFIFHKPRGLLCQPRQLGRESELSVRDSLPPGFPPVPFAGRLDVDTEGLLLFSDDGMLLNKLMLPSVLGSGTDIEKTYYVQCGYISRRFSDVSVTDAEKETIIKGVIEDMRKPIDVKGNLTQPAYVEWCACPTFIDQTVVMSDDPPTVSKKRKRSKVGADNTIENPKSDHGTFKFWIKVSIKEGKNRQIRRLCTRAHVFVIRLIRSNLGPVSLGSLKPGECRSLTIEEIHSCYAIAKLTKPYPETIHCPCPPVGKDLIYLLDHANEIRE